VWAWVCGCGGLFVCVCVYDKLSLSLSLSLSQDVGRSFNTDWLQLYSANAHLTKPHALAEYALINLGALYAVRPGDTLASIQVCLCQRLSCRTPSVRVCVCVCVSVFLCVCARARALVTYARICMYVCAS
jgi:hypothetical protein